MTAVDIHLCRPKMIFFPKLNTFYKTLMSYIDLSNRNDTSKTFKGLQSKRPVPMINSATGKMEGLKFTLKSRL